MSGEGGSVDDRTVAEIIKGLRALVATVDDGALHAMGEGVPALMTTFGVSRATVYRLLAEEGATA